MRLYGKNPVIERLRSNPKSIRKITIVQGFQEVGYIQKKATQCKVSVISYPKTKMDKVTRGKNSQGIFLDIGDYEYKDFHDLLDQARGKKRTLVFLDGITDPQNLGAIVRSLACLGDFSIVLPLKDSVSVTEAVLRVASGGENYVPIAQVSNLNKAIREAKKEGFFIIGSIVEGGTPIREAELQFPLGLVIGSEQKGVRPIVQKECDLNVTVPMHENTLSLNVAQAATIFCYEINEQKKN